MIKHVVRYLMLFICFGSSFAFAQSAGPTAAAPAKPQTDEQKTLYALGVILGSDIQVFALKPEELAFVAAGLSDAVSGAQPQVEMNTYGPKVDELAHKRAAIGADLAKKDGEAFAAKVALEKSSMKTASGIVIRTINAGDGASPTAADVVKVHYEGKLIDGTVFDSSVQRGQPVEFPLEGVVPCWTEALQQMKKGEKAQVVCPSSLAYGDKGSPPQIPPGATLSFEVELLDFHKP